MRSAAIGPHTDNVLVCRRPGAQLQLVIVAAIVISKRRSAGIGGDAPASTEATGAVSPAVEGAALESPKAPGTAIPAEQVTPETTAVKRPD